MDLVEIQKAWEANKPPSKVPFFDTLPGPIPSDWVPYQGPRDATAARKAKIIRGAKIGGGTAAAAAGIVGATGMAIRHKARSAPASIARSSAVSGKTMATVGAGGIVAGTGGGLVLRKRKREDS